MNSINDFAAHAKLVTAAFRVKAVDSTGAGDSFCGGFLAAMMRGADALEAARIGNAYGAQSVSAAGATTGLGGWESVS